MYKNQIIREKKRKSSGLLHSLNFEHIPYTFSKGRSSRRQRVPSTTNPTPSRTWSPSSRHRNPIPSPPSNRARSSGPDSIPSGRRVDYRFGNPGSYDGASETDSAGSSVSGKINKNLFGSGGKKKPLQNDLVLKLPDDDVGNAEYLKDMLRKTHTIVGEYQKLLLAEQQKGQQGKLGECHKVDELLGNTADYSEQDIGPGKNRFPRLGESSLQVLKGVSDALKEYPLSLHGLLVLKDDYPKCDTTTEEFKHIRNSKNSDECGLHTISLTVGDYFLLDSKNMETISHHDSENIYWAKNQNKFGPWYVTLVLHALLQTDVDIVFLFPNGYWRISGKRVYSDFSVQTIVADVIFEIKSLGVDVEPEDLQSMLNKKFRSWIRFEYRNYEEVSPTFQLEKLPQSEFERKSVELTYPILQNAFIWAGKVTPKNKSSTNIDYLFYIMQGLGISLAEVSLETYDEELLAVTKMHEKIAAMSSTLRAVINCVSEGKDSCNKSTIINLLTTFMHVASDPSRSKEKQTTDIDKFVEALHTIYFTNSIERQKPDEYQDILKEWLRSEQNNDMTVEDKYVKDLRHSVFDAFCTSLKPLVEVGWSVPESNWDIDADFADELIVYVRIVAFSVVHCTKEVFDPSVSVIGSKYIKKQIGLMTPTPIMANEISKDNITKSTIDDIAISLMNSVKNFRFHRVDRSIVSHLLESLEPTGATSSLPCSEEGTSPAGPRTTFLDGLTPHHGRARKEDTPPIASISETSPVSERPKYSVFREQRESVQP